LIEITVGSGIYMEQAASAGKTEGTLSGTTFPADNKLDREGGVGVAELEAGPLWLAELGL
jgi:hypothetical protein